MWGPEHTCAHVYTCYVHIYKHTCTHTGCQSSPAIQGLRTGFAPEHSPLPSHPRPPARTGVSHPPGAPRALGCEGLHQNGACSWPMGVEMGSLKPSIPIRSDQPWPRACLPTPAQLHWLSRPLRGHTPDPEIKELGSLAALSEGLPRGTSAWARVCPRARAA